MTIVSVRPDSPPCPGDISTRGERALPKDTATFSYQDGVLARPLNTIKSPIHDFQSLINFEAQIDVIGEKSEKAYASRGAPHGRHVSEPAENNASFTDKNIFSTRSDMGSVLHCVS